MTMVILDTDTLVLFQEGHDEVCRRVLAHGMEALAVTVITVEEQLSGWYTLLRRAKDSQRISRAYQRLADSVMFLGQFRILSFTEEANARFEALKARKLGVRSMDLRIAAIAIEFGGTLVTRNTRDFHQVTELSVENWALSKR